ncbi:hypothetical protein J1N35_038347 [Gossypium stocksii]|uniref:Reverse transcriptase RNase H-like domain-containing protein n=1 Tax=Gossypium stocksii TaxID=47602 RepID=A0A9D3ULL3_9ROSI|nr:hypothetical protein J1N35_038347 [Gossypium stocksii]
MAALPRLHKLMLQELVWGQCYNNKEQPVAFFSKGLEKWVAKMLGCDYEIIYRQGSSNGADDALSRKQPLEEWAILTVYWQ